MKKEIIIVFVAADDKDANAKCELLKHLSQIENVQVEHQTPPGSDISKWINELSNKSDIVMPLLSPDFLVNQRLFHAIISVNIDRHNEGNAIMLPVLLRDCLYDTIFTGSNIGVLPSDKIPVLSRKRLDKIWKDIANIVAGVAEILRLRYENAMLKFELSKYQQ